MTIASSPFAHERAHAWLDETTGTTAGGEDHQFDRGPIWGPEGAVSQISAALAAAGL
jgi:hypothetical protein